MERKTGIEPAYSVWKTDALPLSYIRMRRGGRPATEQQINALTLFMQGTRARPCASGSGVYASHGSRRSMNP